jgi:hypothetical protein
MSLLYTFLTSILLSLTPAQSVPYAKIETAFSQNDASGVVALAKEKVLINILGTEGAYSKSQAILVVKDFFTKKPGNSFDFIFKGAESAEGCFAIGTYSSKSEKFRVTLHFKKTGGDYRIESLSIEKS